MKAAEVVPTTLEPRHIVVMRRVGDSEKKDYKSEMRWHTDAEDFRDISLKISTDHGMIFKEKLSLEENIDLFRMKFTPTTVIKTLEDGQLYMKLSLEEFIKMIKAQLYWIAGVATSIRNDLNNLMEDNAIEDIRHLLRRSACETEGYWVATMIEGDTASIKPFDLWVDEQIHDLIASKCSSYVYRLEGLLEYDIIYSAVKIKTLEPTITGKDPKESGDELASSISKSIELDKSISEESSKDSSVSTVVDETIKGDE